VVFFVVHRKVSDRPQFSDIFLGFFISLSLLLLDFTLISDLDSFPDSLSLWLLIKGRKIDGKLLISFNFF